MLDRITWRGLQEWPGAMLRPSRRRRSDSECADGFQPGKYVVMRIVGRQVQAEYRSQPRAAASAAR